MKIKLDFNKDEFEDVWSCYGLIVKDLGDDFFSYEGDKYDLAAFLIDALGFEPDNFSKANSLDLIYDLRLNEIPFEMIDGDKEDFFETIKAFAF